MGTYFRDVKDFVQVFCIAGMYLMPVVYLPTMVPEIFRPLLYLNPFSYMAWCYQDACYFGRFQHPWAWPVFMFGSLADVLCGLSRVSQVEGLFRERVVRKWAGVVGVERRRHRRIHRRPPPRNRKRVAASATNHYSLPIPHYPLPTTHYPLLHA